MVQWIERLDQWRGRVALVTGATSGIGRATALALGSLGMRVAVAGRRQDRLSDLQRELEALGTSALPVAVDQTDIEANAALFQSVRQAWGGVDVLINSAGVTGGRGLLNEDFAVLQTAFDLNVRAALLCMREAASDMRRRGGGAIINISSLNAHRTIPSRGAAAYAASKQALQTLTDGLRAEVAAEGLPIKVALISPGLVESEFHEHSGRAFPFRGLKPEDVADAVLYILSTPARVQVCDILLRSSEQVD